MANENVELGFIKQWLGLVNDQAEQENLVAEKKAKEVTESQTKETTKPPLSLFSTIVGRGIAVIYGGVIVMLAMTGASLGLLVSLGIPSPLTAAIVSGCISAYINVTGFWAAAPQLIEDIFVTGAIFKKISDGKQQEERISFWRIMILSIVTFLMASVAAGVAITSELHAMTMTGGALQALGIGGLFGLSGFIVPVLLCVGFMAYWVLYSDTASKVLRETNFFDSLKQKLRYLFCIDKDVSLLLPGEKQENASLRLRAFVRMVIFLAIVAGIMFATGGFAIAGVGLMLGVMHIAGVTPAIVANMILPTVATFMMGAWAASVNFKLITLMVLAVKYMANQYVSPLVGFKSGGSRIMAGLLGTVTLVLPTLFVLKGLWGFAKAEGRYLLAAVKEGARVYKEGPGFTFNSAFEGARLKTAYKPWTGIGNIAYNLVTGTRNLVWNTGAAVFTSVLILEPFPPIRLFVTSLLAGVNKFLDKNRKILAIDNAINNAALIGGGDAKPMNVFGTIIPGTAIKSVNTTGGGMMSAGFGLGDENKDELFADKNTEKQTAKPEEKPQESSATGKPVLNSVQAQNHTPQSTHAELPHSVSLVHQPIPAGATIDIMNVPSSRYVNHMTSVQGIASQSIKAQTYTIPGKSSPVVASIYTDVKPRGNAQLSIATAQACVASAYVPGKNMNIDGDDLELVLDAFKVCIANDIPYNNPQSSIAKNALAQALAAQPGKDYELKNLRKAGLSSVPPSQHG